MDARVWDDFGGIDEFVTLVVMHPRGSGLSGLGGIRSKSERDGITLLRPLLVVPKARLVATLPEPLNYVRFGNTGSQMTEAAAMLSRFYRRMTGEQDRNHVITVLGSYHGTGPLATALTVCRPGATIVQVGLAGAEVPVFSTPVDGHSPSSLTAPANPGAGNRVAVPRASDFAVSLNGGTGNVLVSIVQFERRIECSVAASVGTLTVPSALLQKLDAGDASLDASNGERKTVGAGVVAKILD